jgi:hypothetical protein
MSEPAAPAAGAPPDRRGPGRVLKLGAGLVISAACLYALLSAVRPEQVGAALAHARPGWLLVALVAVTIAYSLKIRRWSLMLAGLGARVRFADAAAALMGCVALNNLLPFRAGDVIRVVAFRKLTRVPPMLQLGTLILERLLDLATLLALLFTTVTLWGSTALEPALLTGLRWAAAAIVAAVVLFLAAPAPIRLAVRAVETRAPRLKRATDALLHMSEAIAALSRPALLARLGGVSLLAWLAEGGAFFAVACALGTPLGIPGALLALAFGTLSTMIPSSPGYVGTFHVVAALVATRFGAAPAEAAAYAILIHALLWLSTTAAGLVLMPLAGLGVRRPPAAAPVAVQPEG